MGKSKSKRQRQRVRSEQERARLHVRTDAPHEPRVTLGGQARGGVSIRVRGGGPTVPFDPTASPDAQRLVENTLDLAFGKKEPAEG